MKVGQVMHRNVEWRDTETPLSELAHVMKRADVGAIPISKNDRLVGMVTDRDIALRAFSDSRDPKKLAAEDIMSQGIYWCYEDDRLHDAIEMMTEKGVRRLPVMNADKRLVGMLSLGDVSARASQGACKSLMKGVSAHHA